MSLKLFRLSTSLQLKGTTNAHLLLKLVSDLLLTRKADRGNALKVIHEIHNCGHLGHL